MVLIPIEWRQRCKACGEEFGYSDRIYKINLERGYSRPERCGDCRTQHGKEIRNIANSFFQVKRRKEPSPILGLPYLGRIPYSRDRRSIEVKPIMRPFTISDDEVKNLYEALDNYQVVIIKGPTGCGKSSYIPYRLIHPIGLPEDYFTRHGQIIITQPRIQATIQIPRIVGGISGGSVGPGYEIGYRYSREKDKYDRSNLIIYVTDGTLLNWIAEGKIGQYSIIIIDEAHERSSNIDLILTILKRELPKYPHLCLIISSATINVESFLEAFQGMATLVELKGEYLFSIDVGFEDDLNKGIISEKMKDVFKTKEFSLSENAMVTKEKDDKWVIADGEKIYIVKKEDGKLNIYKGEKKANYERHFWTGERIPEKELPEALADKVLEILKTTREGGILGFLHGQAEVERAIKRIEEGIEDIRYSAHVFPVYAALGDEKNEKAFEKLPPGTRRVLIATNVAETSLTVPDLVYVVDSGMIKEAEWDSEARTVRLKPKRHSKYGCEQRWGRVGRVKPGTVYTLYTEEQFNNEFEDYTSPEITRACLETPALASIATGLTKIEKLPWISKPSDSELKRVLEMLKKRGIIDEERDFTKGGLEIYRLYRRLSVLKSRSEWWLRHPLDEASLLILADRFGCVVEAATALVFLSRIGANIYHPYEGLFIWDYDWPLAKKVNVNAIHEGLRIGCADDLAFVAKIVILYQEALSKEGENLWTEKNFINELALKNALAEREVILNSFLSGKKDERIREMDLSLLDRVRVLMALAWPDQIVNLEPTNLATFKVEVEPNKFEICKVRYSAGDWNRETEALCAAMIREREEDLSLAACFMVRVPDQIPEKKSFGIAKAIASIRNQKGTDKREKIFIDQRFPIGSIIFPEKEEERTTSEESEIKSILEAVKEQNKTLMDLYKMTEKASNFFKNREEILKKLVRK